MELNLIWSLLLTITLWWDLVCGLPTFWCPVGRYPTDDGRCDICFENCGADGCTGPGSHLGPEGCSSCWLGLQHHHDNIECVSPFRACPSGFYRKRTVHDGKSVTMCKPCHPLCSTCSEAGISNCITCRFLRWDGQCVRECPIGTQYRPGTRARCIITGALYSGSSGNRRHSSVYLFPYRDRTRQSP